jgi:hypothetical protein
MKPLGLLVFLAHTHRRSPCILHTNAKTTFQRGYHQHDDTGI